MNNLQKSFVRASQPFLNGEDKTYGTVLLGVCLRAYGAECINWDPLTLESFLQQDFDVKIPNIVYRQLMSAVSMLATESIYHDWDLFDQTVNDLMRAGPEHQMDSPTIEEVSWAVVEMAMNDPESFADDKTPFSPGVRKYLGVVVDGEGLTVMPWPLEFLSKEGRVAKLEQLGEDPEMFEAVYKNQESRAKEIDDQIGLHMAQLVSDLKTVGVEATGSEADQPQDGA